MSLRYVLGVRASPKDLREKLQTMVQLSPFPQENDRSQGLYIILLLFFELLTGDFLVPD